eukprot:m.148156 g.148156  ORF g.148156 m.148156 type:complete len:439 (-) comp10117_c0_seq2:1152-2468(-)
MRPTRGCGGFSGLQAVHLVLLAMLCLVPTCSAWTGAHMAVYDLVDELGVNFYEALGVAPDASAREIRRQFRSESLRLHPDKNPAADAETQFQRLAAIAEVLRDPEQRAIYDDVLHNGMPSWRQPVYYFRRAAKMSLGQVFVFLLVLLSIGHLAAMWATYAVHSRTNSGVQLDKPKMTDLWFFQIVPAIQRGMAARRAYQQHLADEAAAAQAEEEELERAAQDREERRQRKAEFKEQRRLEKQNKPAPVARKTEAPRRPVMKQSEPAPKRLSGPWSDAERQSLVKLCNKYPGGTVNRWEVIAEELNRNVKDILKQVKSLQQNPRGVSSGGAADALMQESAEKLRRRVQPASQLSAGDDVESTSTACAATSATTAAVDASGFTQEQQSALEQALRSVPASAPDRWDAIAACVPGKSKSECIARCKQIIASMRKQSARKTD